MNIQIILLNNTYCYYFHLNSDSYATCTSFLCHTPISRLLVKSVILSFLRFDRFLKSTLTKILLRKERLLSRPQVLWFTFAIVSIQMLCLKSFYSRPLLSHLNIRQRISGNISPWHDSSLTHIVIARCSVDLHYVYNLFSFQF